jgi:cGMP-dependent protein kinase
MGELMRYESTGHGMRRSSDGKGMKFGPGSVLGIGVLYSKSHPEGWKWVDEMANGVPLVGAVPPVTIIATTNVKVAFFTIHQYEKLFGPTSSFYFFSTKEMTDFIDRSRRQSESTEGAPRRMSELQEISENEVLDNIDDKISYSLEYFDRVEVVSQIALGSIAIGYKKGSGSVKTASDHLEDDHDDEEKGSTSPNVSSAPSPPQSLTSSAVANAPVPASGASVTVTSSSPPQRDLLHNKADGKYVLKTISKAIASRQKQENHVLGEANSLASFRHPFIAKLYGKFQTPNDLVLVLERVSGGDLWSVMYEENDAPRVDRLGGHFLSLDLVRFYIASLISALEYMHRQGVAYRNLKPENVLIDDKGYIRLVGFGFAKKYPFDDGTDVQQFRSYTFCGTLGTFTGIST